MAIIDETNKRTAFQAQPPPGPSAPLAGTQEAAPQSSTGKIALIMAGCVVVLGVAIWFIRHNITAGAERKGAGAGRMEAPPVPVIAGTVMKKDMPIYLEGVATVQAFNTVTVRARVDGQIEKVAFVEGQDVKKGDLLAQIDPAPFQTALAQAIAKKGQDEAQLANARVDLKRYADLLANEGVTQQQYDTQKALVNQLEATVKADEAAIESAKVQLDYTTIVSPLDGRTGIRQVDQGNIVHANDSNGLVVITQLKPISVVFTLPAQTLNRIRTESAGDDLTVLAIDSDGTNVVAHGTLAVIDNQIDTTTGTIKLKATFPNNDLRLWPGQFLNARLLLTVRKDSAVVPASVIQRGPEGAFAFVIGDDQTVGVRPVKVALIEQGEAVVEDGLRPGERVVVDGQYKLQKGSRVKMADGAGAGEKPAEKGKRGEKKGKPEGKEKEGRTTYDEGRKKSE
jgi:multidrug efflux system membrane fusion protein